MAAVPGIPLSGRGTRPKRVLTRKDSVDFHEAMEGEGNAGCCVEREKGDVIVEVEVVTPRGTDDFNPSPADGYALKFKSLLVTTLKIFTHFKNCSFHGRSTWGSWDYRIIDSR